MGVGAYVQVSAKHYLDFLSETYLNTPIFIIIAGQSIVLSIFWIFNIQEVSLDWQTNSEIKLGKTQTNWNRRFLKTVANFQRWAPDTFFGIRYSIFRYFNAGIRYRYSDTFKNSGV
jgi:hypothetical protein